MATTALSYTQTTLQKDKDLIKKFGLQNNPNSFINEVITKSKKFLHFAKTNHNKEYNELVKWSNEFSEMYELTNRLNGGKISKLQYLCEYVLDCENDNHDYTQSIMFIREDFLRIFAQRFMKKKR